MHGDTFNSFFKKAPSLKLNLPPLPRVLPGAAISYPLSLRLPRRSLVLIKSSERFTHARDTFIKSSIYSWGSSTGTVGVVLLSWGKREKAPYLI